MSLESPNSDARSLLKDELAGKLVFDDPGVFKRLALDRVSPHFVANCAQSFATDQDLLDARRELDKITAAAIGKPVEELEADEELYDSPGFRKDEEKRMYKPLVRYRSLQSGGFYRSFGIEVHISTRGEFSDFVQHSTKTYFRVYGLEICEIRFKRLGIF